MGRSFEKNQVSERNVASTRMSIKKEDIMKGKKGGRGEDTG